MYAWHRRQPYEAVLGEFVNSYHADMNVLIIKFVQSFTTQVTENISLANDPRPEMLPVDSQLDLMEKIGGYRLINRCELAEII